jgi:hypothetical protein
MCRNRKNGGKMTFFYEEQVGSGDNFFNKQVQKNYRSTIFQFKKITIIYVVNLHLFACECG